MHSPNLGSALSGSEKQRKVNCVISYYKRRVLYLFNLDSLVVLYYIFVRANILRISFQYRNIVSFTSEKSLYVIEEYQR